MNRPIRFHHELIVKARWAKCITQTQMARELGMSRQHYTRIEAGKSGSYDTLRRISVALEIPLAKLLGISEVPETDLAA